MLKDTENGSIIFNMGLKFDKLIGPLNAVELPLDYGSNETPMRITLKEK